MLAVVDSDSFYVAGYFEETKLQGIKIGDRVSIRLLGRGGELQGHVQSVARAITDRDNALASDLIANVSDLQLGPAGAAYSGADRHRSRA